MELSDDDVEKIRDRLLAASMALYAMLNEQFGDFKKAPDDHPIFKVVEVIAGALDYFPEKDEEGEDEEGD